MADRRQKQLLGFDGIMQALDNLHFPASTWDLNEMVEIVNTRYKTQIQHFIQNFPPDLWKKIIQQVLEVSTGHQGDFSLAFGFLTGPWVQLMELRLVCKQWELAIRSFERLPRLFKPKGQLDDLLSIFPRLTRFTLPHKLAVSPSLLTGLTKLTLLGDSFAHSHEGLNSLVLSLTELTSLSLKSMHGSDYWLLPKLTQLEKLVLSHQVADLRGLTRLKTLKIEAPTNLQPISIPPQANLISQVPNVFGDRQFGVLQSFGFTYLGAWRNSFPSGYGTLLSKMGWSGDKNIAPERYEGHWLAAKREGHGVCFFSNGDHYDGEWHLDKIQGEGTYHWKTGEVYQGAFLLHSQCGMGTFTFSDGRSIYASWTGGVPHNVKLYHGQDLDREVLVALSSFSLASLQWPFCHGKPHFFGEQSTFSGTYDDHY